MYLLTDLAKAIHHENLQAAARDQLHGQAYAARRAGYAGSSARRLADLRVLHLLRGRHAARGY